jgi:hypothetical protein
MQSRQDPTPKPGFYVLKIDGGITAEQGAAGPAAIGVVLKDHKYRDVHEISAITRFDNSVLARFGLPRKLPS